jgi:hypothetical protein
MSADRATTILARFHAAHNDLLWKLRDAVTDAEEGVAGGSGWSPAQIGCHVAMTNQWIAGVLSGQSPMAQPAPAGFSETFDASQMPARAQAPASLTPPAVIGMDAALERLRTSANDMSKAIASLTPERGSGYCVQLGRGMLSLFELADFAAAHVSRHAAQVDRAMGRAPLAG